MISSSILPSPSMISKSNVLGAVTSELRVPKTGPGGGGSGVRYLGRSVVKKGCSMISGIVIRFRGSTASIELIKLRASCDRVPGRWKLPSEMKSH